VRDIATGNELTAATDERGTYSVTLPSPGTYLTTNSPTFTDSRRWLYGMNGYYSSNETGWRGTLSLGATGPAYAFRVQGGLERYGDYTAGKLDIEDTRSLFASGRLRRTDRIDDAFGFGLRAFPDPFNAPFVRVDSLVPNSQAHGNFLNASGLVKIGENRSLRVRYHRRRVEDIGFPDFEEPFFFNAVGLPFSTLDKASVRYEARAVLPWLANLSLTGYYQRQQRLLENRFPVQFPAPTARTLFPISVFRLNILSQTEQRVWTPGVDAQAVIVPARDHLLTAGVSLYRDRSSDRRRTETTMSLLGQVTVGPFGPQAAALRSPMQLGPPTVSNPVRVPDASFRDIGLFAQDEWKIRPEVSVIGGLRGDFYAVDVKSPRATT